MSRWDAFEKDERMKIHHALRVLLTHPIRMPEAEEELTRRLADEIWDEHAADVASRPPRDPVKNLDGSVGASPVTNNPK